MLFRSKNKKIKVIVATNGVKEESIRVNWKGYVEHNKIWNGKEIWLTGRAGALWRRCHLKKGKRKTGKKSKLLISEYPIELYNSIKPLLS